MGGELPSWLDFPDKPLPLGNVEMPQILSKLPLLLLLASVVFVGFAAGGFVLCYIPRRKTDFEILFLI